MARVPPDEARFVEIRPGLNTSNGHPLWTSIMLEHANPFFHNCLVTNVAIETIWRMDALLCTRHKRYTDRHRQRHRHTHTHTHTV